MPFSVNSVAVPTSTVCPVTVARTPLPVIEAKSSAAGMLMPRSRAPATIAAARGCSLSASAAATRASSSSSAHRADDLDVGEGGLAGGDGAGLVQHDGVEFVRGLQRLGRADQDARAGALAGADHDGQRGGQAQRAGAGATPPHLRRETACGCYLRRSPRVPTPSQICLTTSPNRLNFGIKTVLIFGCVATNIKTVLIWTAGVATPATGVE